ncbi:phage portal protein [Jeongeupia naejangsanensis]|uniref:Phage portal protein n=1 Tax=Jeongeupia naejangsanensis TaxID=613195 RepID=A0ABS2BIN3_9NEIS|nr:phage portal protein [Jeongeupia naejangsanensis]MBM3114953.1 phage portal protein [Jeongeupia naejangsanensis]
MSRRKPRRVAHTAHPNTQDAPSTGASTVEVFTFGDPEAVLDRRGIFDYLQCLHNGRWYEPPISWEGLAKTFRVTPHHSSPLYVKRNILVSTFKPHPLLSRSAFSAWVLDFLVFGNAYLERRDAMSGRPLSLKPALAKYVRRSTDLDGYWYVPTTGEEHEFEPGSVFHLLEHDIDQEVYGLPEYLSALSSAWLNEASTLFRRRYYKNGSHAGFVLYMTDTVQNEDDINAMRTALKNSKGPGNFRNLMVYAPGGKKDGIQLLPISEVAAKDEFLNIKNVTRDDQLAAHRVPPQLIGIIPTNTGGFGSPAQAAEVFARNEIGPLQARFMELNEWVGQKVIEFEPYVLPEAGSTT